MALVLSLFSDAEMKGEAPVIPASRLMNARLCDVSAVPADAQVLDPCVRCPLADVCSPDDCAQHGFPLDLPFPPTRFRNLGEYINLLKHYGWA